MNILFIALIYASHLELKFPRNNLSHLSIKLIVATNDSNAFVVALLGIDLSPILLHDIYNLVAIYNEQLNNTRDYICLFLPV